MSRAFLQSAEVKKLQEALISLFLNMGSVNKLCSLLNGLLASNGSSQKLYPNRIHGLLSNDSTRAVNAKTFALINQAVALVDQTSLKTEQGFAKALSANVEHHWAISSKAREDIQRIGSDLSAPAVIVEFLLQKAGLISNNLQDSLDDGNASGISKVPRDLKWSSRVPDYTFQERAIKQCRFSLRKSVGRRVGLVSPTGSGKTEMALRIALEELHESPRKDTKVFWVTHRKNLQSQAHQRLQKMLLREVSGIPTEASSLLANRVEFLMVAEARTRIQHEADKVALIIIDEAHHAAAGSYDPIFETLPPMSVLALTATPNRTDGLPIRIDEIGFSITFSELVERGVILMPEFVPFPVSHFDWTPQAIEDLADHLICNASDKYSKVLVIAPQIERVEEFYRALIARLSVEDGHILTPDDIGFLHSQANSTGQDSQTFISSFTNKPRGILISAQMLLEGFDDPQIDTVVITYPTGSLITLMQAAGRCVRHAPGKEAAYVIQARDRASYYFEQRWLYQDISDFARPQLEDIQYRNAEDLTEAVKAILVSHNVSEQKMAELLEQLKRQPPGEICRLLLAGLPYFGNPNDFSGKAIWTGALLVTNTKPLITSAFNEFCARGNSVVQLQHLGPIIDDMLSRLNIGQNSPNAEMRQFLHNLFLSTQNAVREVYGQDRHNYLPGGRPKVENHSTSWLKYITFEFRPILPDAVSAFLAECANRTEVSTSLETASDFTLLLRVPLPLVGYEAFALTNSQDKSFQTLRQELVERLRESPGIQQLATAAGFLAVQNMQDLPHRVIDWMDMFCRTDFMNVNSLSLQSTNSTISI